MPIPTATTAAGACRALPAATPITLDLPEGIRAASPGRRRTIQTHLLAQPAHDRARAVTALRLAPR